MVTPSPPTVWLRPTSVHPPHPPQPCSSGEGAHSYRWNSGQPPASTLSSALAQPRPPPCGELPFCCCLFPGTRFPVAPSPHTSRDPTPKAQRVRNLPRNAEPKLLCEVSPQMTSLHRSHILLGNGDRLYDLLPAEYLSCGLCVGPFVVVHCCVFKSSKTGSRKRSSLPRRFLIVTFPSLRRHLVPRAFPAH